MFYTMFLYVDSSNGFNIFAENGIWRGKTATRKFLSFELFSRKASFFCVFRGGGGNIPNSINCFSFAIIYNDINYIYVLETKYLNFTFISFVNIQILNIERN